MLYERLPKSLNNLKKFYQSSYINLYIDRIHHTRLTLQRIHSINFLFLFSIRVRKIKAVLCLLALNARALERVFIKRNFLIETLARIGSICERVTSDPETLVGLNGGTGDPDVCWRPKCRPIDLRQTWFRSGTIIQQIELYVTLPVPSKNFTTAVPCQQPLFPRLTFKSLPSLTASSKIRTPPPIHAEELFLLLSTFHRSLNT